MSSTHDLREDPLVMIPHEENSGLHVYEENLERKDFYHALILHCKDHELFLLAQGLDTKMVVEKIPCGLTNKEVYAPTDLGIEYMKYVDTSL
jgi:hypothetical protein